MMSISVSSCTTTRCPHAAGRVRPARPAHEHGGGAGERGDSASANGRLLMAVNHVAEVAHRTLSPLATPVGRVKIRPG